MVLTLNTAIRGEQIVESTISGAHILDAAIKPIKLNIVNSPEDGDVLTYNSANAAFEWEKVGTMIANESPTGSINGTNKVFTLSSSPESNSLEVYLNGILQQPGVGNDYTISGTQITFTTAPEIGDIILCSYLTSVGLGGGYYTDHGNLNGLGDDDHLQYILVDGSRAFTGIASYNSHPSFTANTNIVDKKYVDDLTTAVSGSIIKDHGNLTGLNDDDHTQYILVDGTRAFTNAVQYATHPSFSVDTELVDKKYVDDSVSGLSPDLISEGNSKVEVVDIGTGYVTVEIDSAEVARFNDDNLRLAVDLLPEMTGASGLVSTRDIGSPSAKFNTIYCHDLRADAGSIYVNDKKVIEDVSDVITISTDPGQRLKISTTNDSGDVYISGEGGIQLVVPDTYSNHDITISNNSSGGDINIGGTGQTVKINGTVDLANATLDHGDLAGLSDDDHTQYILVNGARSFTGTIGGVTPTATNHLATKGYVDSVVQGLDWQDSVLDKDLTSPPASPSVGDRYLIANNATGAWSGHDGDIAEWNGSSWSFTAKNEGMAVWVEDENKLYTYNGSSWVIFGSTISHNNTSGLNDGDYKHLTANEYNGLTSGNNTTLHIHDSRYYTEAEADARFVLLTDYEDSDILNKIKNVDGSGSGLDADKLDGLQSTQFIRSDANDTKYGHLTFVSGKWLYFEGGKHCITNNDGYGNFNIRVGHDIDIKMTEDGYPWHLEFYQGGGYCRLKTTSSSKSIGDSITWDEMFEFNHDGNIYVNSYKVWHQGNDGSGSGLDADLLDGHDSSYFSVSTHTHDTRYLRKDVNTTQDDGLYIATDEIRARDADGLKLMNDAGSKGIFINDSGHVGIGTSNPLGDLEIKDDSGPLHMYLSATNGGNVSLLYNPDGSYFDIRSNTSDGSDNKVIRIGGGGDVIQSRGAVLELEGNESGANLKLRAGDNSGKIKFYTSSLERMILTDDGELGIGTTSPSEKLDVSGSVKASNQLISSVSTGTAPFQVNSTTLVNNLNADLLDGYHASSFVRDNGDTSLTGNYSTTGYLEAGRSNGGIALTVNDGYGDANVTFNHRSGIPEQDGNAGRIVVNTDATSGAYMKFQLKSNVSSGSAVSLNEVLNLTENLTTVQTSLRLTGNLKGDGYFYTGTTDPTNTTRLNYDGYFYATKVYNAVYNDVADFQLVDDEIIYGKVYRLTESGAKICNERCQLGVIGICSDTFGFGVGKSGEGKAPFAIAGWVLAYVDKTYTPGTPLTCDENGNLTEMTLEEKRNYPERLIAIYDRPELAEYWGPNNEVKVNGRHWVKIK